MKTITEKIIEAYFNGGNAQGITSSATLKDNLKVIIQIVEESIGEEKKISSSGGVTFHSPDQHI